MKEKYYEFISNIDEILDDKNFNELEVLNKYFNSKAFEITKKPICLIKEWLNDDELFFLNMEKFYAKPGSIQLSEEDFFCNGCKVDCTKNVYSKFKFSAFLFVAFILSQQELYTKRDIKNFTIKFFSDFNFVDDEWRWDFQKTAGRILNFNISFSDKSFRSNENTLKNIQDLNEIIDDINTSKSIVNNFLNEKTFLLENYSIFFEKKILFFERKNELDKELSKLENTKPNLKDEKLKPLDSIWLANAKISINDFLQVGLDNKIWDENYNIITKRGSLYSSGKKLLANLYFAIKDYAISSEIDPNRIGSVLCEFFNIDVNIEIAEPFKAFSSGERKIIKEFKRLYKV